MLNDTGTKRSYSRRTNMSINFDHQCYLSPEVVMIGMENTYITQLLTHGKFDGRYLFKNATFNDEDGLVITYLQGQNKTIVTIPDFLEKVERLLQLEALEDNGRSVCNIAAQVTTQKYGENAKVHNMEVILNNYSWNHNKPYLQPSTIIFPDLCVQGLYFDFWTSTVM